MVIILEHGFIPMAQLDEFSERTGDEQRVNALYKRYNYCINFLDQQRRGIMINLTHYLNRD